MKRIIHGLCFAFALLSMPLAAQNVDNSATAEQIGSFRAEMQKQLLIAQKQITELSKPTMGVAQAPSAINRVALEKAMETLDFKTSIVSTYYYSPVLSNFEMQKNILNVLKKDVVTQEDMQQLQIQANNILSEG